jgi:hypothetical protein
MEARTAFCPKCDTPVQVTVTDGALDGHANIPDGEVVCLDFHDKCTEGSCPLYGLPGIVMGVRLARSGMKPIGEWDTVAGVCDGCGNPVELEVLDDTYAYCPECGTTNEWQLIRLADDSHVAVMQKKWKEEGGPPY